MDDVSADQQDTSPGGQVVRRVPWRDGFQSSCYLDSMEKEVDCLAEGDIFMGEQSGSKAGPAGGHICPRGGQVATSPPPSSPE